MEKPRIYISGPISGLKQEEYLAAFTRVENMLVAQGFRVFNPCKNGLAAKATTHEHMRRDISTLTNEYDPFSFIFMMRRWTHSAGCKLEFDIATACGISVIFEDGMNVVKFE